MSEQLQTLSTTIRRAGYSMTNARSLVFSALLDKEPQTMAELAKATAKTVNRASLYRIIALFEQLGIVQRLQMGWKYKLELSDSFAAHHHHLSCINCGLVQSFEESTFITSELKKLARENGFWQTRHQLEVRGYCRNCQPALR